MLQHCVVGQVHDVHVNVGVREKFQPVAQYSEVNHRALPRRSAMPHMRLFCAGVHKCDDKTLSLAKVRLDEVNDSVRKRIRPRDTKRNRRDTPAVGKVRPNRFTTKQLVICGAIEVVDAKFFDLDEGMLPTREALATLCEVANAAWSYDVQLTRAMPGELEHKSRQPNAALEAISTVRCENGCRPSQLAAAGMVHADALRVFAHIHEHAGDDRALLGIGRFSKERQQNARSGPTLTIAKNCQRRA